MTEDPKITEACARMTGVANGLTQIIGPIPAANVLLAAAVTLLATHFGPETAAEYLRRLADDVETDDATPPAGRA